MFCYFVENRSLPLCKHAALFDEFIMPNVVIAVAVCEMATFGLRERISFRGLLPRE